MPWHSSGTGSAVFSAGYEKCPALLEDIAVDNTLGDVIEQNKKNKLQLETLLKLREIQLQKFVQEKILFKSPTLQTLIYY